MQQVHLFIGGYVHSVGFRRFVQGKAEALGLKGWVRNLADRRVEVLAQGEKDSLEKLIESCKMGPFMAEVRGISVAWGKSTQFFVDFQILPTE